MRYVWAMVLTALLWMPLATQGQWTSVGDGIDYQALTIAGPNNLFVARMAIANTNAFIESSIGQAKLSGYGLETTSAQSARLDDAIGYWGQTWGNRNHVVIAINGSFIEPNQAPVSGLIHSGWYAKRYDDVSGQSGFLWTLNRGAAIGECVTHYTNKQLITYVSDGNVTQQFQGINRAPGANDIIVFTPQYDTTTLTDNTVTEVLVELSRPALLMPTPNMVQGVVKQIRQNAGSTPIPFDHVVLSAKGTAASTLLSYATVGDTIGISQEIKSFDTSCAVARTLDWTKTYASISGNWVFLGDGIIRYGIDPLNERHPRTAIALDANYVYFVVCDGRKVQSIGMTIDELAEFCKNTLGATWGVNQDGGGSSTMVVNGVVMNDPSDGTERAVANGMMMCNLVAKAQSTTLVASDPVLTTTSAAVRLGPGTNYASIASMGGGTAGTVQAHNLAGVAAKGSYWWKVAFGSTVGWVDEAQIAKSAPTTTCHVDSIVPSLVSTAGKKKGRATVTIKDNNGNPVANATVTGNFTGTWNETRSAVTDGSGIAVIDTSTALKLRTYPFTFCVTNVTHATLTYDSAANVETCDSY